MLLPFLFSWISELTCFSVIIAITNSFSAAVSLTRLSLPLHLLTNEQWVAVLQILCIPSTFTNIKFPLMKSICYSLKRLIFLGVLQNSCIFKSMIYNLSLYLKIHVSTNSMYCSLLMCLFWWKHNIFCFFFCCYAPNDKLSFCFQK